METSETPQTQSQPSPPPLAEPPPISDADDIEKNKDIAAFSYLWIMSVVVYFLKRKSPFVRFHAKQAMVLFLLSILFLFIPIVSKVLELGVLVLMVLGFINAAQGKKKDIPVIGPLSRGEMSIREAWKQIVEYVGRLVKSFKSEKNDQQKPSSESPTSPGATSSSTDLPKPSLNS